MKRGPGRPRKRLATITEIGEYLQVGRTTVYKLLDQGMPNYRVGHVTRFDVDEVLAWLRGQQAKGGSALRPAVEPVGNQSSDGIEHPDHQQSRGRPSGFRR